MPFSLYSASIPNFRQTLGAMTHLLNTAEAFCTEKGLAHTEIIQARLAPNMLPFSYQIKSTAGHSLGAIEGIRKGVFSPDVTPPPEDFAGLKAAVAHAATGLEAITPAEIESFLGRDMRFSFNDRHMDFAAEDFLLSFSQPNFYFHAATAYDILRWKGVPLGKKDFMGRTRMKPKA
jgi:uncharacterized protein